MSSPFSFESQTCMLSGPLKWHTKRYYYLDLQILAESNSVLSHSSFAH